MTEQEKRYQYLMEFTGKTLIKCHTLERLLYTLCIELRQVALKAEEELHQDLAEVLDNLVDTVYHELAEI